jgi:hypothetical protein
MAGRVLQEKIIGLRHPMGIGNGQQVPVVMQRPYFRVFNLKFNKRNLTKRSLHP